MSEQSRMDLFTFQQIDMKDICEAIFLMIEELPHHEMQDQITAV